MKICRMNNLHITTHGSKREKISRTAEAALLWNSILPEHLQQGRDTHPPSRLGPFLSHATATQLIWLSWTQRRTSEHKQGSPKERERRTASSTTSATGPLPRQVVCVCGGHVFTSQFTSFRQIKNSTVQQRNKLSENFKSSV